MTSIETVHLPLALNFVASIYNQLHIVLKMISSRELQDNETLFSPERRHRSVRAGG